MLKRRQVNITEAVVGKIQNGEMNLFSGENQIGKVTHTESGITYSLSPGYETDGGHIYQVVDMTENPDKKYTDCDQGGWC